MTTSTISDLTVTPARYAYPEAAQARRALRRDGAVVVTGLPVTADALAVAAAYLYGSDLRQLFPYRERTSRDGGPVHLHADSFDVVVQAGGVPVRRRDPDEDAVLIQCVRPSATGGESFIADAYRFVDQLSATDPALVDFLTGTDVDLYGEWATMRGVPATPRVGRHVEYTRAGRRIVRRNDGAAPLPRDPAEDYIVAALDRFRATVRSVEPELRRFTLEPGDILVLDNYRCWHGRDPHPGERTVRILTMRTADAA
ncbi:TauD/TfdA family dioxygenase [Natronosporangium hydrolyticum]|uniref:TauD/TfdA family dioxygenase n=1 Tax=Natronosporangium hydrolyticum TaxID=2811111 RepID=A0A895YKP9_9ACTN|nr:TauD/TfdA family dioxygenase [Natronosporangium hydrolyticum]QSB14418.1 TauD/TfdA family dioxygenase [Natronosporangium hydrolyticum]